MDYIILFPGLPVLIDFLKIQDHMVGKLYEIGSFILELTSISREDYGSMIKKSISFPDTTFFVTGYISKPTFREGD